MPKANIKYKAFREKHNYPIGVESGPTPVATYHSGQKVKHELPKPKKSDSKKSKK